VGPRDGLNILEKVPRRDSNPVLSHPVTWSLYLIRYPGFSSRNMRLFFKDKYPGADKSLARPGLKQAAPVKSVMGRGMN